MDSERNLSMRRMISEAISSLKINSVDSYNAMEKKLSEALRENPKDFELIHNYLNELGDTFSKHQLLDKLHKITTEYYIQAYRQILDIIN